MKSRSDSKVVDKVRGDAKFPLVVCIAVGCLTGLVGLILQYFINSSGECKLFVLDEGESPPLFDMLHDWTKVGGDVHIHKLSNILSSYPSYVWKMY